MLLSILLFLVLSNFSYESAIKSTADPVVEPIVETKLGKVRGVTRVTHDGIQINHYLGIPYAQPPIGDRRFKKPLPALPWNTTFDATHEGFSCMQAKASLKRNISEDCLTLSVWQPKNIPKDTHGNVKKLPVMFWIYGGGFYVGSIFPPAFEPIYLSAWGQVIVVAANYRLGAFGFLYSGNGPEDAPGNMGLHDQLLAMKWIKNNIEAFGGDADQLTIFGQSAGSMSIGSHILSPLSANLFHRAILQSGAPNCRSVTITKNINAKNSKSFAKKVGCNQSSATDQVKCLRGKTAQEILAQSKRTTYHTESINIMHGDEFLPDKPSLTLKNGKFNQVDILFGHVRDEGSYVAKRFEGLDPSKGKIKMTLHNARMHIIEITTGFGLNNGNEVADHYLKGLTDKEDDVLKMAKAISAVYGDFHLKCPTVLFGSSVGKLSKSNNAYAYQLTLPPSSHSTLCRSPKDWTGVCHHDDLIFTSGAPFRFPTTFTDEERVLSKDMILAWTQFAKSGHVSTIGKMNVVWNEAVAKNEINPHVKYMELNKQYRMVENGYKDDCEGFCKKFIIG